MRKIATIFILALSVAFTSAQISAEEKYRQAVKDARASYEKFRAQAESEYAAFRNRANAEYAAFLEQTWKSMAISPAIPKPTPDPPVQPAVPKQNMNNKSAEPKGKTVPRNGISSDDGVQQNQARPHKFEYDKVAELPKAQPQPQPKVPVEAPKVTQHKILTFTYFGTLQQVRIDATTRAMRVSGSEESSIAAAWREAADGRYDTMLSDCLKLRSELQLCDWAYYMLLRNVSKAHYGSDTSNDAKLLQAYLLTQSGYKLRLARSSGKLHIMLPSKQTVYERYITLDGERYYFMDDDFKGGSFYVSNAVFDGEQGFSLILTNHPKLDNRNESCKKYTARRYGTTLEYCPNKNLIEFYDSYPACEWSIYANAKLSDEAKNAIYPTLRQTIAGKSQTEAANIIIDFVQTAFDYKPDGEQFGTERSLFCEETLYYPYSDCEDRAILFTTLIRDLLGLKTVLLYYPGHLAAAVAFRGDVNGDYLIYNGQKYTVCDPTYIGASIGMTMPNMKEKSVEITLL